MQPGGLSAGSGTGGDGGEEVRRSRRPCARARCRRRPGWRSEEELPPKARVLRRGRKRRRRTRHGALPQRFPASSHHGPVGTVPSGSRPARASFAYLDHAGTDDALTKFIHIYARRNEKIGCVALSNDNEDQPTTQQHAQWPHSRYLHLREEQPRRTAAGTLSEEEAAGRTPPGPLRVSAFAQPTRRWPDQRRFPSSGAHCPPALRSPPHVRREGGFTDGR